MGTSSTGTNPAVSGTSHDRLRRALEALTRAAGVPAAQRELAADLAAELSARARGAAGDPFLAHNLAVLICALAEPAETADLSVAMAGASARLLEDALGADPDDLAAALALAFHARRSSVERSVMERMLSACSRPHAGDRLVSAVAQAMAAQAAATNADLRAWIRGSSRALVQRLDGILAGEPGREAAAMARLRLVLLDGDAPTATAREDAFRRFAALVRDARDTFGDSVERDQLELQAVVMRLRDRQATVSGQDIEEAADVACRLASTPGAAAGPDVVELIDSLQQRRMLGRGLAERMVGALRVLLDGAGQDAAVRGALAHALEASGDEEAVLDYHCDLVRRGQAGEDSRAALARHWLQQLEAGAPSGLSTEVEAWIAERFPRSVANDVSPETALLLTERVAATQGPGAAANLVEKALLSKRRLARDAHLVVRAVQLAADAGEPERALAIGHGRLATADSPVLRLTLAKIHVGAGIRIAEADSVVRPLASLGGSIAAEARSLRDEVTAHPDFEAERNRAMREVEERLGVGQDRPVRCRVIFPSDRYVLAEMPAARAPAFYQHRFLRLMVTAQALAEGMAIGDLRKGSEFAARVIGEDDSRGDRIRVYWIKDGTRVEPLAAPQPEPAAKAPPARDAEKPDRERPEKERDRSRGKGKAGPEKTDDAQTPSTPAPTPEEEAAFLVGTAEPCLVRIEWTIKRGALFLGRILPPDGSEGPAFPVRVGIAKRFVPEALRGGRLKQRLVRCRVARNAAGPELRYDAVSEIALVDEPGAEYTAEAEVMAESVAESMAEAEAEAEAHAEAEAEAEPPAEEEAAEIGPEPETGREENT